WDTRPAFLCQFRYGRCFDFRTRFFSDALQESSPLGHLPLRGSRWRICLPATPPQEPESTNRISIHTPSPHGANVAQRCRNVDLLPIDYAFRPRLRGRLTLGGLTFPRKP